MHDIYIYVVINGVANGIKSWLISFTNIYIYVYIYSIWMWLKVMYFLQFTAMTFWGDDQPVDLRYHVFKHTVEASGEKGLAMQLQLLKL